MKGTSKPSGPSRRSTRSPRKAGPSRPLPPTDAELKGIRDEALAFAGVGTYRYAFDGTLLYADRGALKILDLEDRFPRPEDVVGMNVRELLVYRLPPGTFREMVRARGHVRDFEYPFQTLTGKERWALHDSFIVKDAKTGTDAVQVIIRDITARKAIQADAERTHALLKAIIDTVPLPVTLLDPEGVVRLWNPAAERVLGWTREEAMGRLLPTVTPPDLPEFRALLARAAQGQGVQGVLARRKRKDGTPIDHLIYTSALRRPDGSLEGITGVLVDVTERLRMETALAAEKERLAVTLRSIGDGVITTDRDGRVTLLNRVAEDLTGWTQAEAAGRPLAEVFRILHEHTRQPAEDPVAKVLATGRIVGLANHTVLISRDGAERAIADSGAPIRDPQSRIHGVVLVFRDVTEKQRVEAELQKALRLESLGVLAGGIAHDFNNILTVILGNASLARLALDPASPAAQQLASAERAVLMAKGLTDQLLVFAKGGAPVKAPASLGDLIRESAGFGVRGSSTRCEFDLPADLWPASVDANQVGRVLSNLALNGAQAMPTGGVLHVAAENLVLASPSPLPIPPGRYVLIRIRDHGTGILPEHLSRIFDPFFTTKQQGSGLGLAIAYSIVKRHGGHLSVESRLGRGTTFFVHLPASDHAPSPALPVHRLPPRGEGRVLVMDDEEEVRKVAASMLRTLGYEPESAADGAEAARLFQAARAAGRPFDAAILDLTIPGGVGGRETIRELLRLDPGARALASSGYSNDPVMSDPAAFGFKGSVLKPYTVAEMGAALARLLKPDG
jgi:PAS domain S-box-containing protein